MQQVHEFFYDLRQHGVPRRLAETIDAWRTAADAVMQAAKAAKAYYETPRNEVE